MAEIKVTPHHSASYIDSNPKKLEASLALPFVCISYIGNSTPAVTSYTGQVNGTVAGNTDIAHLSPANSVSYVDSSQKQLDATLARPFVCVSYVPASSFEVTLNVDTVRTTANAVTLNVDTTRNVSNSITATVDTSRNISKIENVDVDTARNVSKPISINADTVRSVRNRITQNLDTDRNLGSGFRSWLRFNESADTDEYGNSWTAYNSPTISPSNAAAGKALQLYADDKGANGQYVALDNGITLGGNDFTVDGWAFMATDIQPYVRLFSFFNVFNQNGQRTFFIGQKNNTGQLELNYNNNWSDLSANLKGQLFHFAVVYEHSKSLLTFYINGQVVATLNQVFTRTFYQNVFLGRPNYDANYTWRGTIDEFRIDDGLARWTESFTPPTIRDYTTFPLNLDLTVDVRRNVTRPITLHVDSMRATTRQLTANLDALRNVVDSRTELALDTARNVTWLENLSVDTSRVVTNPLVWRYENYGTVDLLRVEDSRNVFGKQVAKSRSKYYCGFYPLDDNNHESLFPIQPSNELWIKFDVYADTEYFACEAEKTIFADDEPSGLYSVSAFFDNEKTCLTIYSSPDPSARYCFDYVLPTTNEVHTFLIHIRRGRVEAWADDVQIFSVDGCFNTSVDLDRISFFGEYTHSRDETFILSNILISNAQLTFNDNCKMPVSSDLDTSRGILNLNVDPHAELVLDTARVVPHFAWRYDNYGTSDLLLIDAETVSASKDKSKYGSGFYLQYMQGKNGRMFDIPATYEIWIKFDVYIEDPLDLFEIVACEMPKDGSGLLLSGIYIRAPEKTVNVFGNPIYTDYFSVLVMLNNKDANTTIGGVISRNYDGRTQLNNLETVLVHMKAGVLDGVIECWFNGRQERVIGTGLNVNQGKPFENIIICAGNKNHLFSNIVISNIALTLNDNCGVPILLNIDTRRYVNHLWTDDVWRYENYGTADLLSVAGTTIENIEKSQAVYKTAFYQTIRAKCFDIPATKEIWIKFDVYFDGSNRWRAYDIKNSNKSTGITAQTTGDLSFFNDGTNVQQLTGICKKNQLQTVLLHMVSNSSTGIIEAWVDGTKLYTYTGNVNSGNDFVDILLQSDGAGTFFSNVIISNAQIGLSENTLYPFILGADIVRYTTAPHELAFGTLRNVCWAVSLNNDAIRFLRNSVHLFADSLRCVKTTLLQNYDTVRSLPHLVKLSTVDTFGGTPDISLDSAAKIQDFEVRINEQTLTDNVIFTTTKPFIIMEQVRGQYLDYKFNMRIESFNQRGVVPHVILRTCNCCCDIDELLFKQLDYTVPDDERWQYVDYEEVKRLHKLYGLGSYLDRHAIPSPQEDDNKDLAFASTHIMTIADILGKQPVLQFEDFVSTVDITAGGTTYSDLIRSIFGWTARIPHLMINCYIRDDKLFVIQRGHESNTINLNHLNTDVAHIDSEITRTVWGTSTWSKTETREVLGASYWESHFRSLPEPSQSGSAETNHEYFSSKDGSDGLVKKTTVQADNTKTTTEYEYKTLSSGKTVLTRETTYVEELDIMGWVLVDKRVTEHEYLKNTTQAYSRTYSEGEDGKKEHVGNVVSHSNGDSRITPMDYYAATRDENGNLQVFDYAKLKKIYVKQQRTLHGITTFDTSFPVHGDDSLIEITEAIKWLNRRVKETVTLNVYDYPHVFDFNDSFIYDGKVYYLKSNTAVKTSRIVNKQILTIVRWY